MCVSPRSVLCHLWHDSQLVIEQKACRSWSGSHQRLHWRWVGGCWLSCGHAELLWSCCCSTSDPKLAALPSASEQRQRPAKVTVDYFKSSSQKAPLHNIDIGRSWPHESKTLASFTFSEQEAVLICQCELSVWASFQQSWDGKASYM